MDYHHVKHEFDPVYDTESKMLILGSFPSVKSREQQFYYGHKQNRFWKVLAALYEEKVPESIEEKKALLLRNHIALWDVISECDIIGSADSTIRNVVPTDLQMILSRAKIENIFVNGTTAHKLYQRYCLPVYKKDAILLPSTSPANAAYSFERLLEAWQVIKIGEFYKKYD